MAVGEPIQDGHERRRERQGDDERGDPEDERRGQPLLTRTLVRDNGLEIVQASVPLSRSARNRLIVAKMTASTMNCVPIAKTRSSSGCTDTTWPAVTWDQPGKTGQPIGDPGIGGGESKDEGRDPEDDHGRLPWSHSARSFPQTAQAEEPRPAEVRVLGGGRRRSGPHAARSLESMSRRKTSSRSACSGALATRSGPTLPCSGSRLAGRVGLARTRLIREVAWSASRASSWTDTTPEVPRDRRPWSP